MIDAATERLLPYRDRLEVIRDDFITDFGKDDEGVSFIASLRQGGGGVISTVANTADIIISFKAVIDRHLELRPEDRAAVASCLHGLAFTLSKEGQS